MLALDDAVGAGPLDGRRHELVKLRCSCMGLAVGGDAGNRLAVTSHSPAGRFR